MIIYHIHDLYSFRLLCQLADYILGVLPPLHLTLGFHMQIFPSRTVKLPLPTLAIHPHPRLSTATIKPESYVCTRRFDERSGERI